MSDSSASAVAIVGMSGRFPGADNVEAFWDMLLAEREGITRFSDAELLAAGVSPAALESPSYVKAMPVLRDIDRFDAAFFGIGPREAALMDPQHRLFLEEAWHALEDAGWDGDADVGVFAGVSLSTYMLNNLMSRGQGEYGVDALQLVLGNDKDYLATRIAYRLGLGGPAITVQTACSTSLVAVALACDSLLTYQCDMALAGGVSIKLPAVSGYRYEPGSILSPDGHCRTFDARAGGTLFGSGVGVVALKRLSDALANGDHIRAVIRGWATNNDGDRKVGFAAPSVDGQTRVIARALAMSGVSADTIGYVEAHGTATPVGDPIEVRSLSQAFGNGRRTAPCLIGSVKTNVGHLECAAGVTGLIKAALAVERGTIPANLHYETPNPEIDFAASPFQVAVQTRAWPDSDTPRRAGVNSFGMGGTNAHVVIEQPPAVPDSAGRSPPGALVVLSAQSRAALHALAGAMAERLEHTADPLPAIAASAARRRHFTQRVAVAAGSPTDAAMALRRFAAGEASQAVEGAAGDAPRIAFQFTGQGAQYPGMAQGLYAHNARFRATLDRCAALLAPHLDGNLLDVVWADGESTRLHETGWTQPALFAVEYALADLWLSWGVQPAAVLGHSIGEYVAATVAGVFELPDAVRLVAARGRLMQALPRDGCMLATDADEATVARALAPYTETVSIAAVNGPRALVIAGRIAEVEKVAASLVAAGHRCRRLTVSHAFHSPLMQPMLPAFRQVAEAVAYHPPRIPVVSNVTGRSERDLLCRPDYWCRHILAPVRYAGGISTLLQGPAAPGIVLELGPDPVLTSLGQAIAGDQDARTGWVASLSRRRDDFAALLDAAGQCYVRGVRLDWAGLQEGRSWRRVALPPYPFDRQRHWIDPLPQTDGEARLGPADHPLLGVRVREAASKEMRFAARLGSGQPALLSDHRVFGVALLPAAACLEMALAAAGNRPSPGDAVPVLEAVRFHEAMTLPESTVRTVQTVLSPEPAGISDFGVYSLDADVDQWRLHAGGKVRFAALALPDHEPLAAARSRCGQVVSPDSFYAAYAERGLGYGPAFRGVQMLALGAGEAVAEIVLPEQARVMTGPGFRLHPALLDAGFQALGAVFAGMAPTETYLPVGLERLTLFQSLPARFTVHARIRPTQPDDRALRADMTLYAMDGVPICLVEGLETRRVNRAAVIGEEDRPPEQDVYEVAWRPVALSGEARQDAGPVLVIGEESALEDAVAATLGEHAIRMPATEAGVARAVAVITHEAPSGVVLLCRQAASLAATGPQMLEAAAGTALPVLRLVQAIAAAAATARTRLLVVTRGAVDVQDLVAVPDPAGAAVWGSMRTLLHEFPELAATVMDLDPDGTDPGEGAAVAAELDANGQESQVALRTGVRFVARLRQRDQASLRRLALPPGPFRIERDEAKGFAGLHAVPIERRPPGPGEIEIETVGLGLNFRDVLGAIGLYPGNPSAPGGECSGRVVRVGEGVTRFRPGDAVITTAPGSFTTHLTEDASRFFAAPASMPLVEAAGLPVVLLTVWYALVTLADLRRGERVLIHAASGGVGTLAVRVAQSLGAEVIATASPAKHGFVRALGVHAVGNSRSTDFVDVVREATGGAGVDVVLNCLTGDAIPASLDLLKPNSRFIEIGRRDIWSPEAVAARRPDVAYAIVDFEREAERDPDKLRSLLETAIAALDSGGIAGLVTRTVDLARMPQTMELMRSARHTGKIVFQVPAERTARTPGAISPDGTYLITGGLGGLGLLLARHLVTRGCRALALLGRRAPDAAASAAIAELTEAGATVEWFAADVADPDSLAAALAAIDARMPPLRGMIHAAGVLDNALIVRMQDDSVRRVLAPKVAGAWNLHTMLADRPLDHFLLFSSAFGTLGAAGQANYAAANAFLDALAAHRRARGLPALSIAWAGWEESGMAARAASADHAPSLVTMSTRRALRLFDTVLAEDAACVVVLPSESWADTLGGAPEAAHPFLAEIAAGLQADAPHAGAIAELREAVQHGSADSRAAALGTYLTEAVARLLHLDPGTEIDRDRSLQELGFDSLLAIQLRNRVRADLQLELALDGLLATPDLNALQQAAMRALQIEPAAGTSTLPTFLPRPPGSDAPLSFAQRRMWFLARFEPDAPNYTLATVLHLQGAIDEGLFAAAFAEVIRRHEALRTIFPVSGDAPVQRVLPEIALPLEVIDLRDNPDQAASVARISDREAGFVFDLATGPLIRCVLLVLAEDRFDALFTVHHIVFDGWSMALLVEELSGAYFALLRGEAPALPALPVQYADYAVWQVERLESGAAESQVEYWRRRLEAPFASLELPCDRPRVPGAARRGGVVRRVLPAELVARLRALVAAQGGTVNAVLLATFRELLHRLTGQADLLIGTMLAGRSMAEIEPLIGFFANVVILRAALADDPSFSVLVEREAAVLADAIAHGDVPFDRLVEALNPPRVPDRNPFTDVVFILQRDLSAAERGGVSGRFEWLMGSRSIRFDLEVQAWELGDEGLELSWIYDAGLFDGATVEGFARMFEALLRAGLGGPDQPVSTLQLNTTGPGGASDEPDLSALADLSDAEVEDLLQSLLDKPDPG